MEAVMQKKGFIVSIGVAILVGLMSSCVSLEDRTMSPQERQQAEVVGSVSAEWTSWHFFHIRSNDNLKKKAYTELKKVAAQKYPGNTDIQNISIAGSFSGWNIPFALFWFASPIAIDIQKVVAAGDVVSYTAGAPTRSRTQGATTGIEGAINRVCETLIYELPAQKTIAVLSVSARDRETAQFVMDEIEFQLVDSKQYEMVDRKTLDTVRAEQNFQTSGEVSDDSAVTIGNMLGANIVITGSITGSDNTQRLTLKALDVKTAKIVTMAREQF
jgi:hypothetical protein